MEKDIEATVEYDSRNKTVYIWYGDKILSYKSFKELFDSEKEIIRKVFGKKLKFGD